MTEYSFDVGKSLKMILKERCVTQTRFAEIIGKPPSWVSGVATKKSSMSGTIDIVCKGLKLKPSEFIAIGEKE